MSGWKNNLTVESNLVLNVLRKFAYNCSRHRYRLEHLFVVSEHIDQFIIPVICRRIHKLSCCRICIFIFLHTCQQEMEVIRNHQDCFCLFKVLWMSLFYSHQLIDCIEYLLLDTYTANAYGGAGAGFDWSMIPELTKPFFLAGGISTDNLVQAASCQPYCIDVSSGAETQGRKDRMRIAQLVAMVRTINEYNECKGA